VASGHDEGIFALQYSDAHTHAERVDLRRSFPLRVNREMLFSGIVAVLFIGSLCLPHLSFLVPPQKARERADVKRQGAQIQLVATKLTAEMKPGDTKGEIARRLENLGKSMERGRTPKKEALKKLNKLSDEVKAQQEKLAASRQKKSFDEALKELQKQEAQMAKQPEAMKQLAAMKASEKLTEAMKKQDLDETSKSTEELQKELAKALQNKDSLSPEAMKALSAKLSALAKAFKGTNLDQLAKELAKMAEALKGMKLDAKTLAEMMKKAQAAMQAAMKRQLTDEELARMAAMLAELKQGIQMAGLGRMRGKGNKPGGREWGIGEGAGTPRESPNVEREKMPTFKNPAVHGKGPGFTMQFKGAPEQQQAVSPYYKAYGDYKKTAESALDKEEIPAAYRKQVKQYFESIGPSGE